MPRHTISIAAIVYAVCHVAALSAQDHAAEVVCPKAPGPIAIDGKLDEPAWARAVQVGPLLTVEMRAKPDHDLTYAKLLHDQGRLYLAVTCRAAKADAPKRQPRDHGAVWRTDHIEVFFSPRPNTEDDYYHLVIDRGGNTLDAWHTDKEGKPKGVPWNGEWQAAAAQSEEGWTAEAALPFATFGVKQIKPGDLWRIKIGRDAAQDGPIMWPPNPSSSFHAHVADGALYFDKQNLLVNGDFELGKVVRGTPEPWSAHLTSSEVKNKPQGTVDTIEGGLEPGNRALRVTKLSTALWWPQVWNWAYKLEPSGVYEFSIMAKGTMPQVNLRATGRLKDRVAKISEGRKPTQEWSRLRLRFIVPDKSEDVGVGLSAPAGSAGETMYDNAILRRLLHADEQTAARDRAFAAPDWSPDPDPIHGLESLSERAGHKPWDRFWRKDHLMTYRVMFNDRKYGTRLWLLDKSPSIQYCVTASIWPGWNADCSVLMINGRRKGPDGAPKRWFCNADFSRMAPQPWGGMPLWDLEDPHVYYSHGPGKVEKFNFRTGEQRVLATWEPRARERSYGLTKDNRSVFVTDHDGGLWLPYKPSGKALPYIRTLDCYGQAPDRKEMLRLLTAVGEAEQGPLFRILIGTRVYTDTGRTERVIAPISGHTEYLKTFISGRVQFPTGAKLPATRDLDELFQLYHLYPSCSHGHVSYSPDGEYVSWDSGQASYRVRDHEDRQQVRISPNGGVYHTCWFYDQRFYVTCVRAYRRNYDRAMLGGVMAQVFTNGTWQPICDIKMRPAAYYYQGNFATFSRDTTKVHYESSMTGVPKNYIAVMARPQAPRDLAWRADGDAVALSWLAPPHHREIKGYLVYRSVRSGDGYEQITPTSIAEPTYDDRVVAPGRVYYYVVTALEHCGPESGYSAEAARAGVRLPDKLGDPLVIYAEAEDSLVDLAAGDRPGLSQGRDALAASNWYYVYRSPKAKQGAASVRITAPVAAGYFAWLRMRGPAPAAWSVSVDGKAIAKVVCPSEQWTWVKVGEVKLEPGPQRLTLATSDKGAQADLVCLATDPAFQPQGVRPEGRQPPAAVQGLEVAKAEGRTVQLTWRAAAEPDFFHYNVYSGREPMSKPDQKHLLASPTYPEFIDWGLRAGTTYHYAVTAVDRRGNESAMAGVVAAAIAARPYPAQETELRFDQAELKGRFLRKQAPGTHGKHYVMIPEDAEPKDVSAAEASWKLTVKHGGKHFFWLRYLPMGAASSRGAAVEHNVRVVLDGKAVTAVGGGLTDLSVPDSALRPEFWTWARPVVTDLVAVELAAGSHTLTLQRITKAIRYDVLLITDEPSFTPPDGRLNQR